MADRLSRAEEAVAAVGQGGPVLAALEALLSLARHADKQSAAASEAATKAEQVVHVWCESVETQLDQMRRDLW